MTIDVSTSEGHQVSFPDGTDAQTIHNVMSQHFGGTQASPSTSDTAWDVAKSAGSGLVRGLIGAVNTVPMAIEAGTRGVEAAANYLAPESSFTKSLAEGRRQAEENRKVIEQARGKPFYEYEPKTVEGEYARTGGEFAPSALGGGGGIGSRLLTTIPAAAVSETGGQLFKGTPLETPARVVGAVAGGGAGGLAATPRTVERALTSRLPSYVTQEHINQAESLIGDARARGVTLTWPEALSYVAEKPVLTDTQRLLESSAETRGHMGEVMAGRPAGLDKAALEEFHNIAPGTAEPSVVGRQTQEAARGTLNDVRRIINEHTEGFYERSRAVPVHPDDMAAVEAHPSWKELRDRVRNDPILNERVTDLPDNSIGFLNAVKKQFDRQVKKETSPQNLEADQTRAASYQSGANTVRTAAINASPDYEIALQTQARAREELLKPLMAGPLGKMAKTPETRRAIDALFPTEPLPNSHIEIGDAVSALSKRNPWAATQLVRAHVEDAFNRTSKQLVGGPNQFGAAGWAKAIAGNMQQHENLKAAITALPDGAARWNTFEKFLDISKATGTRQPIGSRTAFNTQDLAAMASGGRFMNVAKTVVSPSEWLHFVGDRIGDWQAGKNMEGLAKVITDPKAGPTFRKIAAANGVREQHLLAARLLMQSNLGAQHEQQRPR
jgi:hypothetical protein